MPLPAKNPESTVLTATEEKPPLPVPAAPPEEAPVSLPGSSTTEGVSRKSAQSPETAGDSIPNPVIDDADCGSECASPMESALEEGDVGGPRPPACARLFA